MYHYYFYKFIAVQGKKKKYGCVIVNEGDKLTKDLKLKLISKNKIKYGLS